MPAEGVSFEDKQAVNKALLRSGAAIDEMNCVRKHLSAIKGGRLATRCAPALKAKVSSLQVNPARKISAGRGCAAAFGGWNTPKRIGRPITSESCR